MAKQKKSSKKSRKTIDAAVIIVNWNGKHLLKDCLPSLKKQTYKHFETIVVDNDSSDGSVAFVKKKFPWVTVLKMDKNTGFTGGNNVALEYVLRNPAIRYISTLNNDTVVGHHWLASLVRVME